MQNDEDPFFPSRRLSSRTCQADAHVAMRMVEGRRGRRERWRDGEEGEGGEEDGERGGTKKIRQMEVLGGGRWRDEEGWRTGMEKER